MAGNLDVGCLYSTVQNTSGVTKKFGFLPPHGRELAAGAEFTCFGDIRQAMQKFERGEARRNMTAFEAAIRRGDITILSTPSPIILDDANPGGNPKTLRLHNGTLSTQDACWLGSVSAPDEFEG